MIRNLFGGSKCRTIDVCDIFGDNSGKALYRLDGNANDESGNYHGTETAITYGGGVYERGGVFNNSKILASSIISNTSDTTDFSLSHFVKPNDAKTTYYCTFGVNNATGVSAPIRIIFRYISAGIYAVEVGRSFGGTFWYQSAYPASCRITMAIGAVNHIVVTYSYTTKSVNIYNNSVLISTYTLNTSVALSTSSVLCMGQYNDDGTYSAYSFNGTLDQVRIFNRAITATEVATLYAECAPTSIVDNVNPFEDSSLKAMYQFNGDATDLTGVYNGTTVGSPIYITGKYGNALQTTTVDYVNLPNTIGSMLPRKSFSVSIWMNIPSGVNGYGFSIRNGAYVEMITTATNTFEMNMYTTVHNRASTSFISNTWHLWTITYNGVFLKYYKDGTQFSSLAITADMGSDTNFVRVWGLNYKFEQLRIFSKALTPMEVASLYTETTPLEEPLAYLVDPFKDGSGKALYRLEGNALDESGNYNGTATNVTYGNGISGRCGVFNGSSSSITSGYTALASSIVSFSCWVNTTTTVGTKAILWDGTGSTATTRGAFGFEGTKFSIFIGNGSTGWFDNSTVDISSVQNGAWHHICVTISGTTVKLYKDGALLYTYTSTVALGTAGTTPYYIGKLGTSASGYFNGSIDQARVFNRALTAGEVTTLHTEGA